MNQKKMMEGVQGESEFFLPPPGLSEPEKRAPFNPPFIPPISHPNPRGAWPRDGNTLWAPAAAPG